VNGAKKAIHILGGKLDEVIKFQLPSTEINRSFVKIHEIQNTAERYPRKAGMPAKEPLS
jgi:16S rRNA (guanine527-N7)-methyltransferase